MERLEELKLDLEFIEYNIETAHIRLKEAKEKIDLANSSYNYWKKELERKRAQRDIIEEQIYNLNN